MDDETREFINAVLREMWAGDMDASEALEWAIANAERSCWIAIGVDPMEGLVGDPPPERVWRLN